MLLHDTRMPFTDLMIRVVPLRPGVYALWDKTELIYIGTAEGGRGLRGALEELLRGEHRPPVTRVEDFQVQVCNSPEQVRDDLLDRHFRLHGAYPRFNRAVSEETRG